MSGLSSLSGAPSPFSKTSESKQAAPAAKSESLSSLATAPPLGRATTPTGTSTGSAPWSTSSKKAEPARMSTPVFSSSKAASNKDDDDDALFPKSRGLVKKELRKAASTRDDGKGSDSDEDLRPPSSAQKYGSTASGTSSSAFGTSTIGKKSAAAATPSTTASSSNPIRALMAAGDDDDDDFLASLAPPSAKSTSPVPSTAAAGVGRSASSKEPPRKDVRATSGVSAVTKSVDTLMSFWKEDELLGKPLPIVEEEPQQDNLLADRTSPGPKRGRRAGGEDTAPAHEQPLPSPSPSLSPSPTAASTAAGSGVRISASGAGRLGQQAGGLGFAKPASPFEPLAATEMARSVDASTPLSTSLAGGVHASAARGDSNAAAGSAAKTSKPGPARHDIDDDDLSDSDLPGMGSQSTRSRSTTPPLGSGTSTAPAAAGRRSTSPLGGMSTQQQPNPQPAAHDSWEMDDSLLPDSSNTKTAGKPASTPAAASSGLTGAGAAGATSRHPSRLQHSSSANDHEHQPMKSPSLSRTGAEEVMAGGDEEPSGYLPSFAATGHLARSAPAPLTKAAEGERQRRVLPDSTARANLGGGPHSKDEEERERTAAAMAEALARRERLQAGSNTPNTGGGTASAPGNTGFRLPSERRAIDALSVHINSPAGSTPKLGAPQAASAGAGVSGSGNKGRSALQALDSSTDDELFGPPLQKTKSPAQSQQLGHTGNAVSGASGRLRAAGTGPGGIAASAPEASLFTASQQQQLPHAHGQALNSQASAPPMQLKHDSGLLQPQRGHLPPGVSAGTAHQHAPIQAIAPSLQHQSQQMQQGVNLPPGVTLLNATSGSTAVPGMGFTGGFQPPPNVVPLASMPPNVVPIPHQQLPPGVTQLSHMGAAQLPPGVTHITPLGSAAVHSADAGLQAGLQAAGLTGTSPAVDQMGPLQLRDITNRAAVMQVELDKERAEAMQLKDENARLKKQVSEQEGIIRDKEQQVRDAENRVISHEARTKLSIAETQALSLKESVAVRSELEELKASLSRVKAQYGELEQDKAREAARLRGEVDDQRAAQAAEVQALKEDIAGMVVAAEARGRRAGLIEKEVAEAQIKAQQAAIEEEKEVVHRHRISAELLAQLTEKVRTAAANNWEREERALRVLEREVADKEARLTARDRMLAERENKLSSREKEMESLREELNSLTRALEGSMASEKEEMRREQERLARESVRMSALQSSLMADKEDLKVQVAMERQLLEDAREARRKERESLLSEVAADRKALAAEHADVLRQMDASRAELLQLKSKLVEYEGRAAAALQQALAEEARLAKARKATEEEVAAAEVARAALQGDRQALESEAGSLVEYARKLQQQSAELAANHQELQQLKMDLVEARQEAARELAEAHAKSLALEDRARQADILKKNLDQDRVSIASERRGLNEERLAASQAASDARDAQLRLAEAVRQWIAQGVPIPFTVESTQGGAGMTVKPGVAPGGPIPCMSPAKAAAAAGNNNRRDRSGSLGVGGRSRNSLRYMLDKLGLDMMMEEGGTCGQPGALAGSHADYIRQQKQFLTQLRMSAPSAGIIHPVQAYQATVAPIPAGFHASDFKFMSQGATTHSAATASFHGFTNSAHGAMHQQPQQQRAPAGSLFPPDMGSSGAATGNMPYGMYVPAHPLANMQYEQSDASDRHTGMSSDFPAMLPVSTTTSEHDGGHSAGDESEGQRSAKAGSRAARQTINRHISGSEGMSHMPTSTVPVASLHSHRSISTHPIQGLGHMLPEASCSSGAGSPGPQAAVAVDAAELHSDSSISGTDREAVQHAVQGGAAWKQGAVAGGGGRRTDLSDTAVSPLRSAGVRTPTGTSSGSSSKAASVSSSAAGH